MILNAIKVSCVEIRALGVIHPRDLVLLFGSLGIRAQPLIQICANLGHLSIKLRTLLRRLVENVPIDPEHCSVDP